MTGNGNHTTYKNGDDWGGVYFSFTLWLFNIAMEHHHSHGG